MIPGPLGPAGDGPVVVCRLVDAPPFRRFLELQNHRDLALIVSDSLYHDVVRTGLCALNPAEFQPMRVVIKGATFRGHIYCGTGADLPLVTPPGRGSASAWVDSIRRSPLLATLWPR